MRIYFAEKVKSRQIFFNTIFKVITRSFQIKTLDRLTYNTLGSQLKQSFISLIYKTTKLKTNSGRLREFTQTLFKPQKVRFSLKLN